MCPYSLVKDVTLIIVQTLTNVFSNDFFSQKINYIKDLNF